jgi:hypothetical protein
VITWETKFTPLRGLVEIARVDPIDLGWVYDEESGAITPAPDVELNADLSINLPVPTVAEEKIRDHLKAGLTGERPHGL